MRVRMAGVLAIGGLLAWGAAWAGPVQQSAGVVCRPSTPADAAKLEYRDGSATNIHAAPGTSAQNATVVCALQPTPPGHAMTRATIAFFDPDRRWSKCYFHNLFPGIGSRTALTVTTPGSTAIGVATLPVDATTFVPHAARCTVRPGQILYAVETEFEPFP